MSTELVMLSNHLITCYPSSHFAFNLSQHQGFFPISWLFISGGQSTGASASASVLPKNIQGWFPLEWTGSISLLSKGCSRVFSQHCDSKALILQHSSAFSLLIFQLQHQYMTTGETMKKWSKVTQSCPTLCDPMDCSLPGSSIICIFQARTMEWIAVSFSRGSSWARDWTGISRITGRLLNVWATREVPGETIALTIQTFVGKVMALLFNALSGFVIAVLPRSKCLLISWLQSPSAVILESKKIKSVTASTFSTFLNFNTIYSFIGYDENFTIIVNKTWILILIKVFWILIFDHIGSLKYKEKRDKI